MNRIADPSQRENLGIIVQYKVKVKLCIGGPLLPGYKNLINYPPRNISSNVSIIHCRDLVAELPFILMHPKPEEEDLSTLVLERSPGRNTVDRERLNENAEVPTQNLIQLDG